MHSLSNHGVIGEIWITHGYCQCSIIGPEELTHTSGKKHIIINIEKLSNSYFISIQLLAGQDSKSKEGRTGSMMNPCSGTGQG